MKKKMDGKKRAMKDNKDGLGTKKNKGAFLCINKVVEFWGSLRDIWNW